MKMARDLRKAVETVLVSHRKLTEDEAKKTLRKLMEEKRYLEDVWS